MLLEQLAQQHTETNGFIGFVGFAIQKHTETNGFIGFFGLGRPPRQVGSRLPEGLLGAHL